MKEKILIKLYKLLSYYYEQYDYNDDSAEKREVLWDTIQKLKKVIEEIENERD